MCLRTAEETLWEIKRTFEATVNACSPRTARKLDNEVAKIAAVGRNQWKISRDMAWELRLSQPRVHVVLLDDQFYKILWIDIACFINDSLFNFHSLLSEYERILTLFEKWVLSRNPRQGFWWQLLTNCLWLQPDTWQADWSWISWPRRNPQSST
jgi:hypothetical protein